MTSPRVMILRAPGTNCDEETAFAFEQAGARADRVHINRLIQQPELMQKSQILCLPGGFSYGDDIGAGRILSQQMRHHLFGALAEFKAAGKLILGICNGFQVLIQSGVLLEETAGHPPATLTWNDSGRFEDRWVDLAVHKSPCIFLMDERHFYLPVAHAEGRFAARDESTLQQLAQQGQLPLRYTTPQGEVTWVPYPANPNGSMGHVAGACDKSGRVFGLMPHPERHIEPTHHPRWTRGEQGGSGRPIFENAVRYFA